MALCQKENQINQHVITEGKQNLNKTHTNKPNTEAARLRNKSTSVIHTVLQKFSTGFCGARKLHTVHSTWSSGQQH